MADEQAKRAIHMPVIVREINLQHSAFVEEPAGKC